MTAAGHVAAQILAQPARFNGKRVRFATVYNADVAEYLKVLRKVTDLNIRMEQVSGSE